MRFVFSRQPRVISLLTLVTPNRRQPVRNLEPADSSARRRNDNLFTFCRPRRVQFWAFMIPKDLLDILVCPACKKPLELRTNPEALKCTQCHRVYPVRDDIPVLLVDEATIEPS